MKKQPVVFSTLQCDECSQVMTIPRKVGKQRGKGHVKHMYCPTCQVKTAFIEGGHVDPALSFWDNWHEQRA